MIKVHRRNKYFDIDKQVACRHKHDLFRHPQTFQWPSDFGIQQDTQPPDFNKIKRIDV